VKIADIKPQLLPFYPESYAELRGSCPAFPAHVTKDVLDAFLNGYAERYNPTIDKETWFADLKEYGQTLGFAMNNEQFKQGGYIGKTGDLAMILRIALCCAPTTPDLYETLQVLGRETVASRLRSFR
jgi:glutamyl/glutaminyl-tRNA synthetase